MTIHESAQEIQDELVALRRELHQDPEIGLMLPRTQTKVLTALAGLPLEITLGSSLTSITAVLRGGRPGPSVLLRGDMDALPVTEKTGLDYASRTAGVMHACGHDLNTAMLVGAAQLLAARQDSLAGDVIFMFQPGEEGCDGGAAMVAEGVLNTAGSRPVSAYALHVFSASLPYGRFSARPGVAFASSDELTVTVRGVGGHGSAPHRAKDPIPAACTMVNQLQTMVTRSFDPFDPVVLTVGTFHAGTRSTVIPDVAEFQATIRTFSRRSRAEIKERAVRLVHSVAGGHDLEAEVCYDEGYPVTINHPMEADFAASVVTEVFGTDRFQELQAPLTGSEDFSRVLDEVPGCFVMLGACPPGVDHDTAPFNHSSLAVYDDRVLCDGAALYAELAVRRLERETS